MRRTRPVDLRKGSHKLPGRRARQARARTWRRIERRQWQQQVAEDLLPAPAESVFDQPDWLDEADLTVLLAFEQQGEIAWCHACRVAA